MILTIAAVIAGLAAIGTVAAILVYLAIRVVRQKLEKMREKALATAGKRFLARYKEGNYETVSTGIWSDQQEKITDGTIWKAETVDPELTGAIDRNEVVILD